MARLAYIRTVVSELVFSLVADNSVAEFFNAIGHVLEFFQIAAFVFSPSAQWGYPTGLKNFSYVLLNFHSSVLLLTLTALVVLMDFLLIYLLVQVATKGGISSYRALLLARLLLGTLSTFLFIPILENTLHAVLYVIRSSMDTITADEMEDWLGPEPPTGVQAILVSCVVALGLLIPTIGITLVSSHDLNFKHVSFSGKACPRLESFVLILKLAIAVTHAVVTPHAFPNVLLVLIIIMYAPSIIVNQFYHPLSNTMSMMCQGFIVCIAIVNVVRSATLSKMIATSQELESQGAQFLYIALICVIPCGVLVAILYAYRLQQLIKPLPIWSVEFQQAKIAFKSLFKSSSSHSLAKERAADLIAKQKGETTDLRIIFAARAIKLPVLEYLERCGSGYDVQTIAFTLFTCGTPSVTAHALLLLLEGTKVYADNQILQATYLSIYAKLGERSVATKQLIVSRIQRVLHINRVAFDIRFIYYKLVKHYNFTQALANHGKALRWAHQFWKTVALKKASGDVIGYVAETVQGYQYAALHHYRVLLQAFPTATTVLRFYAMFVSDCINNPKLADDIFVFAERLDDDKDEPTRLTYDETSKDVTNNDAADITETKSEGSHRTGASSSAYHALDVSIISDAENFDLERNKVAMWRVRSLSWFVAISLFMSSVGTIVGYTYTQHVMVTEVFDRTNLINAAQVSLWALRGPFEARTLDWALQEDPRNMTLVQKQLDILKVVGDRMTLFYNQIYLSVTEKLTSDEQDYWATPSYSMREEDLVLENHTQSVTNSPITTLTVVSNITFRMVSPSEFFVRYYLALTTVAGKNGSTLLANSPELRWVLFNGLREEFHGEFKKMVSIYQLNYQAASILRSSTLRTMVIVFAVVPWAIYFVAFLPLWFRIRMEVLSVTHLFSKVPRKICWVHFKLARKLEQEMLQHMQQKDELEGIEPTHERGDEEDEEDAPVEGYRDKISNEDLIAQHSESAENENNSGSDNETQASGATATTSNKARSIRGVLLSFILSLFVSVGLFVALSLVLRSALNLISQRSVLINYSGQRLPLILRMYTLVKELIMFDADALLSRNDVRRRITAAITQFSDIHKWVLFGNSSMEIPKTVGIALYDKLNFQRVCSSYDLSCLSIDEGVQVAKAQGSQSVRYNDTIVAQLLTSTLLKDIDTLAHPDSAFMTRLNIIVEDYAKLNADLIESLLTIGNILLGITIPTLILMALWLHSALQALSSTIRCIRNMLWQLPKDTIHSMTAIRDYLKLGEFSASSIIPKHRRRSSTRRSSVEQIGSFLGEAKRRFSVLWKKPVSPIGKSSGGPLPAYIVVATDPTSARRDSSALAKRNQDPRNITTKKVLFVTPELETPTSATTLASPFFTSNKGYPPGSPSDTSKSRSYSDMSEDKEKDDSVDTGHWLSPRVSNAEMPRAEPTVTPYISSSRRASIEVRRNDLIAESRRRGSSLTGLVPANVLGVASSNISSATPSKSSLGSKDEMNDV